MQENEICLNGIPISRRSRQISMTIDNAITVKVSIDPI